MLQPLGLQPAVLLGQAPDLCPQLGLRLRLRLQHLLLAGQLRLQPLQRLLPQATVRVDGRAAALDTKTPSPRDGCHGGSIDQKGRTEIEREVQQRNLREMEQCRESFKEIETLTIKKRMYGHNIRYLWFIIFQASHHQRMNCRVHCMDLVYPFSTRF
jgi:hypothetical protein